MKKQSAAFSREQALNYAAGLCARCEQCENDIRRKLTARQLPAADLEHVISWLFDHDFLNDERFARAFARDKARFNRWGRVKIRMHLTAHKLPPEAIAAGLAAIDGQEYLQGLKALARQLGRTADLSVYEERMKLARRLAARGFEPPLAITMTEELRREAETADTEP